MYTCWGFSMGKNPWGFPAGAVVNYCLPRQETHDRGDWWAAVHEVTKNGPRLSTHMGPYCLSLTCPWSSLTGFFEIRQLFSYHVACAHQSLWYGWKCSSVPEFPSLQTCHTRHCLGIFKNISLNCISWWNLENIFPFVELGSLPFSPCTSASSKKSCQSILISFPHKHILVSIVA